VVDLDEIRDNDHNLNITRYVQTDPPPPPRVSPIYLKVVEHEDGFALTLHEELLLTSFGGGHYGTPHGHCWTALHTNSMAKEASP
jgi:hypothetical protein